MSPEVDLNPAAVDRAAHALVAQLGDRIEGMDPHMLAANTITAALMSPDVIEMAIEMELGDESRPASVEHFCEVMLDGVDFNIECGVCGYTERSVDTSYDAARRVADDHEQTCNGEGD